VDGEATCAHQARATTISGVEPDRRCRDWQEVTWSSWQIATLTSGGIRKELRNARCGCEGNFRALRRFRRQSA